jgi:hypothetical protein
MHVNRLFPLVSVFDVDVSGIFNPVVLHLLFLFWLPRGSSTQWPYVQLMLHGSSTQWSYTCYFCFDCPGALQPGGLMCNWCLEALQSDGLTHVVSSDDALGLFNSVVLHVVRQDIFQLWSYVLRQPFHFMVMLKYYAIISWLCFAFLIKHKQFNMSFSKTLCIT